MVSKPGVLGVLGGAKHSVAVRLELVAMRLGQLAERVAVLGPRRCDQIGCHRRRVTFFPGLAALRYVSLRTRLGQGSQWRFVSYWGGWQFSTWSG